MECPKCGHDNDDGARFCSHCGAELPPPQDKRNRTKPEPRQAGKSSPSSSTTPAAPGMPNGLLIAAIIVLVIIVGALATSVLHTPSRPLAPPRRGRGVVAGRATEARASVPAQQSKVAAAAEVLQRYLTADLRHDGPEMRKYLGGQALKRFRPEAQRQEKLTVRNKAIIGRHLTGPDTVSFRVVVKWSPQGSEEIKKTNVVYVLKRTAANWKITSTPPPLEGE